MKIELSGKTAVVCGSTQGIGKASAMELSKAGASVILISRNEDSLKTAVKDLDTSQGQTHSYLSADFSKPNDLEKELKKIKQDVHILINNTGGPPGGKIADANVEEFRVAFNQHLICNHILAQALLPGMKKNKYGRIINIISTSIKQPIPGLGVSNTIRGAVNSWSKTLSREVAADGITVNNVLPGATETQRLTSIIEKKASNAGISVKEASNKMKSEVPANRFAMPEEPAQLITFLASAYASYINGVSIAVDGGRTASL
ncbi:MAG: SDR family oxidoreductase [Bacteroidia bacterium]|nr:SDR family oxidoreductase [Bacteroidia bacterium]NNM16540.1 SDR family oxidoreductase [Bacteroidia bacterium]